MTYINLPTMTRNKVVVGGIKSCICSVENGCPHYILHQKSILFYETFEDTEMVIRSRKAKDRQHNGQKKKDRHHNSQKKKDRHHNSQKKKDKGTNNDHQKIKDRATRTPLKTGMLYFLEIKRYRRPCSHP
jgi:hypothetical protein